MKKTAVVTALLFLSISAVSAQPARPHQFYGDVTIDGESAPNGTTVKAVASSSICEVVDARKGQYGYESTSNIFKVPAECGEGETLTFFVNDTEAATYDFSSGELTRLDLGIQSDSGSQQSGETSGSDSSFSFGSSTETTETNEQPVGGFTWETPVRPNEPVVFDASGSFDPDGNLTEYRWSFGATGETAENIFGSPGRYTVNLTVVDAEGSETKISKQVLVEENEPPVPRFDVVYTDPIQSENVRFNASESYDSDGEITAYEWSFGDNGVVPTHSFEPGEVNVTLRVIDNEGKSSTVSRILRINSEEDQDTTSSGGSITGAFTSSASEVFSGFFAGIGEILSSLLSF